jgi:predicted nucleic acid-binding protein
MSEYRAVLLHPTIRARFTQLTPRLVSTALRRLRYVADEYETTGLKFHFPRDPRDAMFIELAIAGFATHIVTLDRDLLSLPASSTDAGKRFRQRLGRVEVVQSAELLEQHGRLSGVD